MNALVPLDRPERPYPGLRPFEAGEWSIFFGREPMIDEVIDRLARDRLVIIHGASGSGKSSLVRAGVLPRLALQHESLGLPWLTCAMRPAGGPLWNLATELARFEGKADDSERIATILRGFAAKDATLASVAAGVEPLKGKRLCILVDQFEELFRFEKETSRDIAELFIDLLAGAAKADPALDLYVIVTMRSEFLGDCARFDGLGETINRSQYLVPRMDDEALLRAVRDPALSYGYAIDEDAAERLIGGVRGQMDELPLLQHGLMRMWDKAKEEGSKILDAALVSDAGGLGPLLSAHADEVMGGDEARVKLTERLFRELTDINAEGSAIRRPRRLAALAASIGAPTGDLRAIIDGFRAEGVSFLTPYGLAPIDDTSIIDISHEALIRCWSKVASPEDGWLKREFDDGLAWRSLLADAAAFKTDDRRFLSAATEKDRRTLFDLRNDAWSLRYGGGWDEVRTLLDASRSAARVIKIGIISILFVLILFVLILCVFYTKANSSASQAENERKTRESLMDSLVSVMLGNKNAIYLTPINQKNDNTDKDIKSEDKNSSYSSFGIKNPGLEQLKTMAEDGDSRAMLMLGLIYANSINNLQFNEELTRNYSRSWIEKSIEKNIYMLYLQVVFFTKQEKYSIRITTRLLRRFSTVQIWTMVT